MSESPDFDERLTLVESALATALEELALVSGSATVSTGSDEPSEIEAATAKALAWASAKDKRNNLCLACRHCMAATFHGPGNDRDRFACTIAPPELAPRRSRTSSGGQLRVSKCSAFALDLARWASVQAVSE